MTITATEFDTIRDLVYNEAAIVLEAGKEYLVESRMAPVLSKHRLASLAELAEKIQGVCPLALKNDVVEAMTTNETSFFRDHHPFEALRKEILPQVIERNGHSRRLSIWCGACSSGQEPYSISMILKEHFESALAGWRTKILATDLSPQMIERCHAGLYSELEINRGLPAQMMVKYLERDGLKWRMRDEIRGMVEFRVMNLVAPWQGISNFDIVFLRNVLIYFDVETKRSILANIAKAINPGGYLLLGGAETAINLSQDFSIERLGKTVVYRLLPE